MRLVFFSRTALGLALPVLLLASAAGAKTLIVGQPNTPCPDAQYSTIMAAVNAAAPHDRIRICPALYPEQVVITKPLTLVGVKERDVNRVLIQPSSFTALGNTVSVITVANTKDVVIENIAVDASKNGVTGCTPILAAVHYLNASGKLDGDAIFGAQLTSASSCSSFFGNGYGALIETDGSRPGPFEVTVASSSFHDFTRDGIVAQGSGLKVDIVGNSFTGVGPSSGSLQFSVFVLNGTLGIIKGNTMSEGNCGSIDPNTCINLRSEGPVLRAAADGSTIEENVITKVQFGIFLNGGNRYRVLNNIVTSIDAGEAIQINAGITNSLIANNLIMNGSVATETCGIFDDPQAGNANNNFVNNTVNDAYCGVAFVSEDRVVGGRYLNTLYDVLDVDFFPTALPPPVEP